MLLATKADTLRPEFRAVRVLSAGCPRAAFANPVPVLEGGSRHRLHAGNCGYIL